MNTTLILPLVLTLGWNILLAQDDTDLQRRSPLVDESLDYGLVRLDPKTAMLTITEDVPPDIPKVVEQENRRRTVLIQRYAAAEKISEIKARGILVKQDQNGMSARQAANIGKLPVLLRLRCPASHQDTCLRPLLDAFLKREGMLQSNTQTAAANDVKVVLVRRRGAFRPGKVLIEASQSKNPYGDLNDNPPDILIATRPPQSKERDAARSSFADLLSPNATSVMGLDALLLMRAGPGSISWDDLKQGISNSRIRIEFHHGEGREAGCDDAMQLVKRRSGLEENSIRAVWRTREGLQDLRPSSAVITAAWWSDLQRQGKQSIKGLAILVGKEGQRRSLSASRLQILAGDYPLAAELLVSIRRDAPSLARSFRQFIVSADGQMVVRERTGLVDQGVPTPALLREADQESRSMQEAATGRYLVAIKGQTRAHTPFNIRFESGSDEISFYARLNPGVLDNVRRLVESFSRMPKSERPVLTLVGHTDSDGPDDFNLKLGLKRAEAVARELRSLGLPVAMVTAANSMGKSAPIAANESEEGKSINRRVELWCGSSSSRLSY